MRGLESSKAARMCPKCASDSRVYNSREQSDGTILRHRECLNRKCKCRFATVEHLSHILPTKK